MKTTNLKTPPFLRPGATIGITAPSFGCTIEPYISRFKEACRHFEQLGYKLKIGDTVYKSDGIGISTDPRVAARELCDFYCDPAVDAIISAGGGELMCETLSYVDFDRLRSAPAKWFMGYSDNTNFIFPLVTGCGVKAIYGSNISGFGKPWEEPEEDTLALLEGRKNEFWGYDMFQRPEDGTEAKEIDPLSPYVLKEKKVLKITVPKALVGPLSMSGVLIGGCLDVLTNLCGTRFDFVNQFNKENDRVIWILEACDLSPMGIRRAMWNLKEAGWFEKATGFVIGRPLAAWGQKTMGVDQYNAVTDIVGELNVPIIFDVDVGHIAPDIPLVMGAQACVKVEEGNISVGLISNLRY